jgi:hypothetical protein
MPTDAELLRAYADEKSEAAFGDIYRSYIRSRSVSAAAMRILRKTLRNGCSPILRARHAPSRATRYWVAGFTGARSLLHRTSCARNAGAALGNRRLTLCKRFPARRPATPVGSNWLRA